jgi:glycosyltransferase involved in cell wall biosynthesis
MKVGIIGSRGIPSVYGGFETFVEHLAHACIKRGIEVMIVNEKDNPLPKAGNNMNVVRSTFNKREAVLKFYKNSLSLASDCDIILTCGVGGAFYYSDALRRKVKIITNVDGLEHRRKKYSVLQRMVIYILQILTAKRSDIIIADSEEIKNYWMRRFPIYKEKINRISYGADPALQFNQEILSKYSLVKNAYFLIIARLVPENNIYEIIKAYGKYFGKKKLVVVGTLEESSYVEKVRNLSNENVHFLGGIYNKEVLDTLRKGCYVYLHGHSVGGTNPSLLEAMSAGCACICHDNIFNREVTEGIQLYFHQSSDLANMFNLVEKNDMDLSILRSHAVKRIQSEYTWEAVCNTYIETFIELNNERNQTIVK